MEKLTIEKVKDRGWLIFEAITGSRAYGLDTATSDTDIRGVFILPMEHYYGLEYTEQVSNETNDIVYYELRRFIQLLFRNNPNIIELLNIPADKILYRHSIMEMVESKLFLSKLCEQTFANYAYTQIKKAYGLDKKILNPVDKDRRTVLNFCYVYEGSEALPFDLYRDRKQISQEQVGLSALAHLKDCYNLYVGVEGKYSGIVRKESSNDVALSSVPKGETPVAMLYFNKDGYSAYCKTYREYWEWVDRRNDARYQNTLRHGKNYDSKNMMHVFRLLLMAGEIATESKVHVHRMDREFLLSIKNGEFEYEDLLEKAEQLKNRLPELYRNSSLQMEPDAGVVNDLLITLRKKYYGKN
jgi:hypothetical protein